MRDAIGPGRRRQASAGTGAVAFPRAVALLPRLRIGVQRSTRCLTFAKAALFPPPTIAAGDVPVPIPRAERSRLDAQTLSEALTVAWDLLMASDDPAVADARADDTRR